MQWLEMLETPTEEQFKETVVPKPKDFTGSKYPTEVSDIRFTGTPEFIETVAGLHKPFLDFENAQTRLEISLKQTEDRTTGKFSGNYALYLSVAERG